MARKRTKPKFHVQCKDCGWHSAVEKVDRGQGCERCESKQLEVQTDLEDWLPESWAPPNAGEPTVMERRLAILAVLAGLATPTEMVSCLDEIRSSRDTLSPNVPVVMVRRGYVSEPEARALLNLLGKYERTPVDLEFGNLAQKTGHVGEEDVNTWQKEPDDQFPPAPWPVKALETGRMQVPAILSVLEFQEQRNRGLRAELRKALRRPPRSRKAREWGDRIGRARDKVRGLRQFARRWGRRTARLVLIATILGAAGVGAYTGYRHLRMSLKFSDTTVSLLRCTKCQETVAWEGTEDAVCPGCDSNDLYWVRRCANCFRVQTSESYFPYPPDKWERCQHCGEKRWVTPYRFFRKPPLGGAKGK